MSNENITLFLHITILTCNESLIHFEIWHHGGFSSSSSLLENCSEDDKRCGGDMARVLKSSSVIPSRKMPFYYVELKLCHWGCSKTS